MMKRSMCAGADPGPRHSCAAGRPSRRAALAALAALAAGPACSSEPALPLVPCGVETRTFGDEVRLSVTYRGYDERGNHVLSERDNDADGIIDDRFVWQYGPGGGVTRITHNFGSGTMREIAAEYDDDHRLESVTWAASSGEAGRADYEYDGEQRIIERWDRDDDGVAEESVTYTYDAGGKLLESASRCAGVVEPRSVVIQEWGQGGRIERIEDRRGDEVNAATQYTYDQDGRLESWEHWFGDTVVASETFEYDAAGSVQGRSTASVLSLGQDPPTWSVTDTVYDADGRILSSKNTIRSELSSESTYLYECPEYEDSPGRDVGAPASPLPPPPMGPRAGVGPDDIIRYILGSGGSCP